MSPPTTTISLADTAVAAYTAEQADEAEREARERRERQERDRASRERIQASALHHAIAIFGEAAAGSTWTATDRRSATAEIQGQPFKITSGHGMPVLDALFTCSCGHPVQLRVRSQADYGRVLVTVERNGAPEGVDRFCRTCPSPPPAASKEPAEPEVQPATTAEALLERAAAARVRHQAEQERLRRADEQAQAEAAKRDLAVMIEWANRRMSSLFGPVAELPWVPDSADLIEVTFGTLWLRAERRHTDRDLPEHTLYLVADCPAPDCDGIRRVPLGRRHAKESGDAVLARLADLAEQRGDPEQLLERWSCTACSQQAAVEQEPEQPVAAEEPASEPTLAQQLHDMIAAVAHESVRAAIW